MKSSSVIVPGSFDPITLGHLDIITRASSLFEKVYIVVLNNTDKNYLFTIDERRELISKSVDNLSNVIVDSFDGLLVDYINTHNIDAIVKGIRNCVDFEYEYQLELTNKSLYSDCETIYFSSNPNNINLSSTLVKSVAFSGGDIKKFVPKQIYSDIKTKINERKK